VADDKNASATPKVAAWIEQCLHGTFLSLPASNGRPAVEPVAVKKWLARRASQLGGLVARTLHTLQDRVRIQLSLMLPPAFVVANQIGLGPGRIHSTRR
jgi:hypothetical protein